MLEGTTRRGVWICLSFTLWPGIIRAQRANPEDQIIDTIRTRTDIGASDRDRIARWVQAQVDKFAGSQAFRKQLNDQYGHPSNSEQFRLHLTAQTARIAEAQFADPGLNPKAARALARVLVDMNRPDTFPGLIAGLRFSDAATRYLCATGLHAQQRSIASDNARFDQALQALRGGGMAEIDPIALGRIYEALSFPAKAADLFDTYLSLFDKRLAFRRGPAVIADGAERYAFEFFRKREVLGILNSDQKMKLAARLAVFLRLDAERYTRPDLNFYELDTIERMLDGVEEILSALAGNGGGNVRNALSSGGHDNREAVLREAYRWVGNTRTNERGALNEPPWNVPLGAP